MSKRTKLLLAGALGAMVIPMTVVAQGTPNRKGPDTLYFNTNVGSFKILGGGESKANGDVDFTCKGTVLISGLEGTVVAANMKEEINDQSLQKRVFFGNGHVHVKGKFSAIQFFGRDLKAVWTGWGLVRLYGEFDKNLSTGEFWYGDDPQLRRPWQNGGLQMNLPKAKETGAIGGTVAPKIRDKG